jgi:hypothetical protein
VTHADGNPGPDLGQAQNKLITFNHLEKNWRLQTTKGLWFIIGARECYISFCFYYRNLRRLILQNLPQVQKLSVKDKDNILKYLQEALPKCEIDFFKEKDI